MNVSLKESYSTNYNLANSLWNKKTSKNPMAAAVQKVCYIAAAAFAAIYESFRNLLCLIANTFNERKNPQTHPCINLSNPISSPIPINIPAINYLHPITSQPIHTAMPVMTDADLVTGVYYNILFPGERQNKELPALMVYLSNCLEGETLDFLSPGQFETLNTYGIKSVPRKVFSIRLANYTLDALQEGKSIREALFIAQKRIEQRDIPACIKVIERLQLLSDQEQSGSPSHQRYTLFINALDECVSKLDTVINHDKKLIEEEFKKGDDVGKHLLEKTALREKKTEVLDKEKHLELFENRLNVIEQAVNSVLDKTPHAATFLAVQEATPDAVDEMKKRWKDRNFTWISFNNTSGEETRVKSKEDVFGESTAFTSTAALSPILKVKRVALGALPSPSGSTRRILGIETLNIQTGRSLAIFTTHTDHLIQKTLYHDTAVAVHQFVKRFLQEKPDMARVFGGDLNAFETSGAAQFIDELRQDPFAGGQDYREGEAFYVSEPIVDSTFMGREDDRFKANFINGKLESNALDHILTNHVKVVAGTRSDVVYDEEGNLIDPQAQQQAYLDRLTKRKTASDHFLNAVIFR